MISRMALKNLEDWKSHKTHQALMVMGARQVGKTTLIREFAAKNYRSFAEINFYENATAIQTLSDARDTRDLLLRLSVLTGKEMVPGDTLLFLDEIQECKDMITWIKFLVGELKLDVILSGSLLGLEAFVNVRSLPVGFLSTTAMYPLTFREYAAARGISDAVWDEMEEKILSREIVPEFIHDAFLARFREYLLVGGMPDAVQSYLDLSQMLPVRRIQESINELYRADIGKYVEDLTEARQIRMVFDAIPAQLNSPSKRFKYARIEKNLRFANLETAFDWLTAAGVAIEATRVGDVSYPILFAEDRASFKFFPNDVGLLTSRLMGDVSLEVLTGKANINYGSIFEAFVAQELFAQGVTPHYYSSKKRGEVDFVVEDQHAGRVRLIEVKSGKDYKRHSALSGLIAAGDADDAVVLYDGNVESEGHRTYLPIYAASLVPRIE